MELVEIFRYLSKSTDVKITGSNFSNFVHLPIKRQLIIQWNKDFDKIKFDVAHGRGNKCTLSSNPVDLIRYIMDRAVYEWLLDVRKNNGVVSGLQLQNTADSVLHILTDDFNDTLGNPYGRPISFATSPLEDDAGV